MPVKIKKSQLWKALREHCLECAGFSHKEVRLCPAKGCWLWPYRMGGARVDTFLPLVGQHACDDPRNHVERKVPKESKPERKSLWRGPKSATVGG